MFEHGGIAMTKECMAKDCNNEATKGVMWRAWAAGYPKRDDLQVEGMIGLYVCDDHVDTIDKDVLEPGWPQVQDAFAAVGKVAPDFERAEIRTVPIAEALMFRPEGSA